MNINRYEVGTQSNKYTLDCKECALRKAREIEKREKVYIRDTYANVIIYDKYFNTKEV